MSIPVQCPACQHAFAVADRFAGKKGKCPKCGMIFKAESRLENEIATFPDLAPPDVEPLVPQPKRLVANPPPPPANLSSSDDDLQAFPTVPLGQAVAPMGMPVAPAAPAFAVSESGGHSLTKSGAHARYSSKSSSLPLILAGVGGAVALVVLIGVIAWSMSGSNTTVVENNPTVEENGTGNTDVVAPPVQPPPPSAIDTAKLAAFKSRVLMLNIKSPRGASQAACFLLDNKGYAATSYQAVAQASSVEAVGPAGILVAVPGTSAIDVAHDLAIIKLEPSVPISMEKFDLVGDENLASGTNIATFDPTSDTLPVLVGKVKGSSTIAKLSPPTRAAIKRVDVAWADDTLTVQHDIRLPEKLVGSPLVNSDGQVLAMHVVGADVSGGLAVHVKHIAALLNSAGSDIKPWSNSSVAATDTPLPMIPEKTTPDLPTPMPTPEPMQPPPPRSDDPIENLVINVKEYHTECDKLNWKATDAGQYARFQLLAKFLTLAAAGADQPDLPPAAKEKLAAAVRNVTLAFPADRFPDDKAWEETNKLAAKALETPGEGVFAYAEVTGNAMLNNEPASILQLRGTNQLIIIMNKLAAAQMSVGSKVLVMGIHQPNEITINNERKAAFVASKYVLLVEQE